MPFPGVPAPPPPVPTPPNLGYAASPAPLVQPPEEHQVGVETPAPPPTLTLHRKKSAPVTEKVKDTGVREAKDVRWHADFSSGLFAKAVPQYILRNQLKNIIIIFLLGLVKNSISD